MSHIHGLLTGYTEYVVGYGPIQKTVWGRVWKRNERLVDFSYNTYKRSELSLGKSMFRTEGYGGSASSLTWHLQEKFSVVVNNREYEPIVNFICLFKTD